MKDITKGVLKASIKPLTPHSSVKKDLKREFQGDMEREMEG